MERCRFGDWGNICGQNYEEVAGKVVDMIGLKADMTYDMEWNDVELETGETRGIE